MVDYGIGNLRSVQKALEKVGATVVLSSDPDCVRRAKKLVLPGVGAFGAGMAALRQRGLTNPINRAAESGVPIVGICLGMQLLFDESEEMGTHEGLGLLRGNVVRFRGENLKVPHMGWNQIEPTRHHPLLAGLPAGAHAYFVHSYYCAPKSPKIVIAETDYGDRIAAIAGRDNVVGIQFHPEKSQQVGLRILHNFVHWIPDRGNHR